jgi:quercetin dioxygenase-like cupin family protein
MITQTPPSGPMSALQQNKERARGRHQEFGIPDLYLSHREATTYQLVDNIETTPLRFDVRNGLTVNILTVKGAGGLGRHLHLGPVTAYTLEGSWGYREYDWVARAGDFVQENPGVIHTLYTDTGFKALFFVHGGLEFYDDNDNHLYTRDVFDSLDQYVAHCEKSGIPVDTRLIY